MPVADETMVCKIDSNRKQREPVGVLNRVRNRGFKQGHCGARCKQTQISQLRR
jgi:hypothetical protein